jgi:hypothetical protein
VATKIDRCENFRNSFGGSTEILGSRPTHSGDLAKKLKEKIAFAKSGGIGKTRKASQFVSGCGDPSDFVYPFVRVRDAGGREINAFKRYVWHARAVFAL